MSVNNWMDEPDELPYEGAKAHYILDIENRKLVTNVIDILFAVTPIPKRKKKADRFQMDYSVLKQQEGASLALTADDAIMVSIAQESGTVDVIVGMDEKEPIYEGNELTNTSFTLNILQSGTYQITVTGHDACGNVSFTKVTAKPEVNRN